MYERTAVYYAVVWCKFDALQLKILYSNYQSYHCVLLSFSLSKKDRSRENEKKKIALNGQIKYRGTYYQRTSPVHIFIELL